MEKPFAINKISVTEKVFNEAAAPILKKKYNSLALKVGGVLCVLLFLISAVTGIINGGLIMMLGYFAVVAAVVCYVRFPMLSNERKRAYSRMTRGGTPERETRFYSGGFKVISGEDREDTFEYEDVLSTRQTENLLILTLKEGREVLLDRAGFDTGDENAVLNVFMRK